jgi:NhaA family Na+:H+ antiporter
MKHKQYKNKLTATNVLTFLFKEERRSGVLLIFAAITALLLANSNYSDIYFSFIHKNISIGQVTLDLHHWVSEGLMAIFFLVVVLEVKREFIDGELNTWRKASFPVIAAIGGMILPAVIYTYINPNMPQSYGWAIPIATDIAIAIGVLALLGRRIPRILRIFILSLAIIDDIGSIVVIAIFYSHPTNTTALFGALILCFSLLYFRTLKTWLPIFLIIGLIIWYLLLSAGISATMAGVIVAALSPLTTRRKKSSNRLQSSEWLEDTLLPISAYVIVPLFVFTSAGLVFNDINLTSGNGLMVFVGVVAGLMIGKPLGIISATWLATSLRITSKPKDLNRSHIIGIGFIAGIGFTISLLIADLSFVDYPNMLNAATFGVFVASIFSGLIGLLILTFVTKRKIY